MSAYSPYCRLYNPISNANLVLDGCSVQALISDVHASVILSQRFTSPAHWNDTVSVIYAFGMMADAAVCGFEMVRQDGTKIEGIVKEKQEAKHEYDEAIKAGQIASLGQQETADGMANSFSSYSIDPMYISSFFYRGRKHSSFRNRYDQLTICPTPYGRRG